MIDQGIRTHTCGELRASHTGQTVGLSGWVASHRDMGALLFLDLRDRYGITQVSFDETVSEALRTAARALKPESVVHVVGTVRPRPDGQVNAERATGEVEVLATELRVLGPARTPPFEIGAENVSDELRLRFRYLDLRRPRPQAALALRHKLLLALRNALDARGFLEIETPVLTKATPEGARDYLVPSRVHPGKFFALPQSPQIFKQILMVAGMDKYFQIVKCFRDEDLRADRQPEFTQLDMEMSFVGEEQVQETISEVVAAAVGGVRGETPPLPFPRITWTEAMRRYGSDKPDTRFGVELADVTDLVRSCGFAVFGDCAKSGGRVRMLAAPVSRGQIKRLEKLAKDHRAKGLAWAKVSVGPDGRGSLSDGIAKFLEADLGAQLVAATGASDGDVLLAVADTFKISAAALGAVRLEIGRTLGLVDSQRLDFLWVVDFPMFERDESTGALSPAHHPFCSPLEETPGQLERDPENTLARSYDLVLNGSELGSGSVRIHDSATQRRVFQAIGLPEDEIDARFGFVIDAFTYGAPPHAGFAVGLDRLVMILAGEDSIREVIAFPKTAQAACLMTGAPTTIPAPQLAEAGVAVLPARAPQGGASQGAPAEEAAS
ncbi:MAG: aspartate--tRNA ligase [Planctomycetes bacterium]|nr:aspartate--tRNA ligase [Planctomycetota bacterium]